MGNMKGTAHPVRPEKVGTRAKLIHIKPDTFKILSKRAIDMDMNLKNYIEKTLDYLAAQISDKELAKSLRVSEEEHNEQKKF